MDSEDSSHRRNNTSSPSIPLQDLSRPPETAQPTASSSHRRTLSERSRQLLERGSGSIRSSGLFQRRYAHLEDDAEDGQNPPRPSLSRRAHGASYQEAAMEDDLEEEPLTPTIGGAEFQAAMGGLGFGLSFGEDPGTVRTQAGAITRGPHGFDSMLGRNDSNHSLSGSDLEDLRNNDSPPIDADTTPLTDARNARGFRDSTSPTGQRHDRNVQFSVPGTPSHRTRLGDELMNAESGITSGAGGGLGRSASIMRSLSPVYGESPFARAGTIVRKMSQRVVNLTNEPEALETHTSQRRSHGARDSDLTDPRDSQPAGERPHDGADDASEKTKPDVNQSELHPAPDDWYYHQNPLKGKSLGIFPPDSPIRMRLCSVLVHPVTEPIILVLILVQTVLLAIDSGTNVFDDPRSRSFGGWSDYALLGLFVIYTIEIVARVIVSGFVINPVEYSTINRQIGLKKALLAKSSSLFALHPDSGMVNGKILDPGETSILRALTYSPTNMTGHGRQQMRFRLAHRAFMRHSFNRVDFLAVVSFWISFVMTITQYESTRHMYVFRMLSCLRILRLLSLTSGTQIILRSLKKAAPLLLNVALLIGFFWLIFAIIGVQAFKSSLRRTCVWQDPSGNEPDYAQNQTGNFQFCGGYVNASTGAAEPFLYTDGTSSGISKGYLCPANSLCISSQNPYSGTVSYDNILQSIELVFVIMTSNTFSDLMYYLADSDYLAAALFSAAGIVILSFWLINLLIAVITSSFQIIREESRKSAFADRAYQQKQYDMQPKAKTSELKRLYDRTFWLWIAIITYGLVVQCFRSANMSNRRESFINVSETTVTFILLFEILIRFAVDWRAFFKKRSNVIDLTLAAITTIIQIPIIHDSGQPYAWLTIFQILRSYRVVLAIPWTRNLIVLVLGNVTGLVNLILFVFLLTFLSSIFAAQLFRGELPQEGAGGQPIHVTFATIYNSFLGMYQILSSENWTTIMYNVTNYDTRYNTAWIGAAFFILWFILAYFIVLNMFIAVIQENFDVSEDEKRVQQVKAFLQNKELGQSSNGTLSLSAMFKLGRFGRRQDPLDYGPAMMEQLLKERVVKDFLDESSEPAAPQEPPVSQVKPQRTQSLFTPATLERVGTKLSNFFGLHDENPFYARINFSPADEEGEANPHKMAQEVMTQTEKRRKAQREYLVRHPQYNVSLFLFGPRHPLRRLCQKIVGPGRGHERIEGAAPSPFVWYAFSAFLYMAIVAMVILACITTPLYQKQYFEQHKYTVKNWFVMTDLGFAILFSAEALIRVLADGFFWTPHAYFRSSWGLIDGVVLITLWINVGSSLFNDGAVSRAVGAFKALRALRLLNVSDSARETFHSVIIRGGWKVLSAAFVSLSLLIPFAIYGLNLFNGKFQSCNDNGSGITNLIDCVGEYNSTPFNWDVVAPRVVANPYYSFDNFGDALFILFQIVSQEGWTDVMWTAESISGAFTQPRLYASQGNAVFFVVFNLLGAVFVLTLFISVFMRNYTEQTGVAFLTTEQRSWLELRKLLRQISPSKRPSVNRVRNRWSQWCYKVSMRKTGTWQRSVTAVLLLHLILLCLEFYPEEAVWETIRNFVFLALTAFYVVNIVVRIVGLSWTRFRKSAWDLYSLVAVGGTLIVTVLFLTNYTGRNDAEVHAIYVQLHKLFLVSMVLLLIPRNNQLDQLFKTAAASLTAIANLLATWFVLFLVYAIALTQTFGLTRFGNNESGNINFRTVPKALILLFRMSVGEGWNQIMEDYAGIVPPYCTDAANFLQGDCGSQEWARVLFISWNILSMYIFVNMFISLIYESFSYVYQRSSGLSVVSRDEIRRFKQAWAEYDPEGSGFIPVAKFPRLLGELSGVFEMRIYTGDFTVYALKDACKKTNRTSSLPIEESSTDIDIDIDKLNRQLAELDIEEIRHRRRRLNVFYEEMLHSADPDRGIAFTTLLMTLAHYKVINDNKSLRLEEFLRRRARLQRVEDDVRRRIVSNFLDTVYWARQFHQVKDAKNAGRMTTIPQLQVPEIFVEDQPLSPVDSVNPFQTTRPNLSLQIPQGQAVGGSSSRATGTDASATRSAFVNQSPWMRHRPHDSFSHQASGTPSPRSSFGDRTSADLQRRTSAVSMRSTSGPMTAVPGPGAGWYDEASATDLPSPMDSDDGAPQFDNAPAQAARDRRAREHQLHFGEGLASAGHGHDGGGSRHARGTSNVSARDVLDVLDNSAWGQSLRRSVTTAQRGQSLGGSSAGSSHSGQGHGRGAGSGSSFGAGSSQGGAGGRSSQQSREDGYGYERRS